MIADPPSLNASPLGQPPDPAAPVPDPPKWASWVTILPALAALWAYRTTMSFGLLADARFLIVDNSRMRSWSDLWPNLTNDYFWSASGNTIPYWRPVTKASWLAETILGGSATWPFHAVQVGWWALACAGAAALALELGAWPIWAGLAGIVLALHPAATEPVGLVMARSDVVAAAAVAWSLAAFARNLRTPSPKWVVLHVLALCVALGSKEAAAGVPGVLVIWLAVVRPQVHSLKVSIRLLVPAIILIFVYIGLRRLALGPRPGAAFAIDPLRWVAGAGQYAVALLPGRLDTGIVNLPRTWAALPEKWLTGGAALLLLAVWSGWAAWRRKVDVVPLAWMALALLPVLAVEQLNVPGVDGKIPLADRWLLPAALAAQVLLAVVLSRLRHRWPARLAFVALLAWTAARLLVVDGQVAAYASEPAMVALEDRHYAALPPEHRTQQDRCRHATRSLVRLGQAGDYAGVLAAATTAEPACQADPEFRFNRLAAQVEAGQFAAAVVAGQGLLRRPTADRRFAAPTRYLLAKALVETGHARQAEPLLQEALRLGLQTCDVASLLARARAAAADWTGAAAWHGRAAKCVQATGPDGVWAGQHWLAAAGAWQRAGKREKALRDLERARRTLGASAVDPAVAATPTHP